MTYAIRPAGPEDASGITALRRMPGVFEQAASLPSDRPRKREAAVKAGDYVDMLVMARLGNR